MSFVGVIYCQVDVFVKGRSIVQRNSTRCGVSECDLEIYRVRILGPQKAVEP